MNHQLSFIEKLRNAIDDEYSAHYFYGELKEKTKNELFKNFIEHAEEDELEHYKLFQHLHHMLTGKYHEPNKKSVDYETFEEGVELALKDELEAVDIYREMLFQIPIPQAYYPLFRAMTDEMEHAIRFSTIYGRLG